MSRCNQQCGTTSLNVVAGTVVFSTHTVLVHPWPPQQSVMRCLSSQLVVVSRTTWNGEAWNGEDKDVSNVLEVLSDMLDDTNSPTYGKVHRRYTLTKREDGLAAGANRCLHVR